MFLSSTLTLVLWATLFTPTQGTELTTSALQDLATLSSATTASSPRPATFGCHLPPGVRVGVECISYAEGVVTFRTIDGSVCEYWVTEGWEDACANRCPGLMDVMYNPDDNQSVACVPYHGPGVLK